MKNSDQEARDAYLDDQELERLNEEALRSIPTEPEPVRTWSNACPACKLYPDEPHTMDWRCLLVDEAVDSGD